MNDVKRRIYNNRIGLGFAIAVLVYIISLYPELLTFRSEAQSFPFIFMTLTLTFALIKILLDLTDSKYLHLLDNISLVSKSIKSSTETETITKKEFLYVILFFVFFLITYLFGFLISVFSYTFLVTYVKYRNLKLPMTVSVLLTALAYAFDLLLPGGLWEGVVFK